MNSYKDSRAEKKSHPDTPLVHHIIRPLNTSFIILTRNMALPHDGKEVKISVSKEERYLVIEYTSATHAEAAVSYAYTHASALKTADIGERRDQLRIKCDMAFDAHSNKMMTKRKRHAKALRKHFLGLSPRVEHIADGEWSYQVQLENSYDYVAWTKAIEPPPVRAMASVQGNSGNELIAATTKMKERIHLGKFVDWLHYRNRV